MCTTTVCYTISTLLFNIKHMYTKQDFINSINQETRIIKHLFEKIPEGKLEHKLTEKQRTTLELLQYLSVIASAGVRVIVENDQSIFTKYMEASKETHQDNFIEIMDKQVKDIEEYLKNVTEEDLKVEVNIFNAGTRSKGVYLVEFVLKWLVAYKMQLFLYIKSAGNDKISTSNLWAGMDMPTQG